MSKRTRIEPLHLRSRPATVGELRTFCAARSVELPWYYRIHRPDAEDAEWARFVPHTLAVPLGEHLDESLPGSIGWSGLPDHPAWRVPIPSPHSNESPDTGDGDTAALDLLRSEWLAGLPSSEMTWALQILRADPLTAIDKYRLVDALRRGNLGALPDRVLALARCATSQSTPAKLQPTVAARQARDWRSVADLTGLSTAPPDAVWLRAELSEPYPHFGSLERLGAVGLLSPGSPAPPCALVPEPCAWADVLVWPGRLFDDHWYAEETPSWP